MSSLRKVCFFCNRFLESISRCREVKCTQRVFGTLIQPRCIAFETTEVASINYRRGCTRWFGDRPVHWWSAVILSWLSIVSKESSNVNTGGCFVANNAAEEAWIAYWVFAFDLLYAIHLLYLTTIPSISSHHSWPAPRLTHRVDKRVLKTTTVTGLGLKP